MSSWIKTVTILTAFIGSAVLMGADNPIQHPVKWYAKYRPCVECPQDSVLNGTITFTPLPEFMKPCRMRVEYYNGSDTEGELILRLDGYQKEFQISAYEHRWQGPFHAGDTLQAEFELVPMKVGVIIVAFVVYQPTVQEFPDTTIRAEIPCGEVIAPMILGPDGKVAAMNSPETNQPYATFLGPYPEVMPETLYFYRDPKVPLEIAGRGRQSTKWRFFAIEAAVTTRPDDSGYYHAEYKVSPYHDFDGGVRFHLSPSYNVVYRNKSEDILTPVTVEDTCRFSMDFKATSSGGGGISASFLAPNPEEGNWQGDLGYGEEEVRSWLKLDFGHNENMKLQYITDETPGSYLHRVELPGRRTDNKRLDIQLVRDRRVAWLLKVTSRNR
jgi:hypothetical protein